MENPNFYLFLENRAQKFAGALAIIFVLLFGFLCPLGIIAPYSSEFFAFISDYILYFILLKVLISFMVMGVIFAIIQNKKLVPIEKATLVSEICILFSIWIIQYTYFFLFIASIVVWNLSYKQIKEPTQKTQFCMIFAVFIYLIINLVAGIMPILYLILASIFIQIYLSGIYTNTNREIDHKINQFMTSSEK